MKGKSYQIPFGIAFKKKYYCHKCGAKLDKERTHRVVDKYDKDYYQFQDYNRFPRYSYDVYDYRFKCPSCHKRTTYVEQCAIEKIQKKCNSEVLSYEDVKQNYIYEMHKYKKKVLIRSILFIIIFNVVVFMLAFFLIIKDSPSLVGKEVGVLLALIIFFLLLITFKVFMNVKSYRGNFRLRFLKSYSYEEKTQLEILHTYSSNNKKLIDSANKCHCFHCKSTFESKDIKDYVDEGKTALCPKCGIDSVIPDSIDIEINEYIIDMMNMYWF